jgi:hypothetical protein
MVFHGQGWANNADNLEDYPDHRSSDWKEIRHIARNTIPIAATTR